MNTDTYDLVINNGHIVDPESGWDKVGSIGIKGDKIAAISEKALSGKETIDAKGLIVSPGFIDLHSHGQKTSAGWMQAFDGVTTALELESGVLGIADFYNSVAKEGRPINYGAASGAAFARIAVMDDEKPIPTMDWFLENFSKPEWQKNVATDDQVNQIVAMVEQGLKEGGIGIGINAGYMPGIGRKENYRLAELAKKYDVPTYTHCRYVSIVEPQSSFEAIEELIGLSFNPGAHMHICHLNSVAMRDVTEIADMIKSAQAKGGNLTVEAYPYGASETGVGAQFLLDADWRNRIGIQASDIELMGKPMDDASLANIQKNDPGNLVVVHILRPETSEADNKLLSTSVLYPGGAISSDSVPWQKTGPDIVGTVYIDENIWPLPKGSFSHPRSSGTFAKFIGNYVREQKAISLLEAIRKTTLIPAQILEKSTPQMKSKGRLKVGADADVIVFDLEKIIDRGTFVDPCQTSAGMEHVIVNGTSLIKAGELDTTVRPGKPVRRPITT